MSTQMTDELHSYLSNAITTSLVAMVARERGYYPEECFDSKLELSELSLRILAQIEEDGITAAELADHVQSSIFRLFLEEANAKQFTRQIAEILWQILGDPGSGGELPPMIYQKAGMAMHLFVLSFFRPTND